MKSMTIRYSYYVIVSLCKLFKTAKNKAKKNKKKKNKKKTKKNKKKTIKTHKKP